MIEASSVSGCLVGAAVGDALGGPFEFKVAGTYARRFPTPVLGGVGEMIGGGGYDWAPGEFTDDTQMGVLLAQSLVDCGLRFDPDDLWSRWRTWAQTASDVGITTSHSLSFKDWRNAKHEDPERTAANGALMRAFPLALLPVDRETRREWTLKQAALTHPHPDAGFGAWLGVAMMRAGIDGDDPFEALEREIALLPVESQERFASLLAPTWSPAEGGPGNGSVWGCLAHAVWAVRGARSFEDAVVRAVNCGDDADTVACVAGAIAGALFSEQAIPSRWLAYVHGTTGDRDDVNSEYLRLEDLENLARTLAGDRPGPPQKEPAVGPVEVFPNLYAANRSAAETAPNDWAIISLCRTEGYFVDHEVRRQSYVLDSSHGNPNLALVVEDVVATIDALLAEGQKVLVHCEGGRSRTCLALKAWWMTTTGGTHAAAREWLRSRWTMCRDHNKSFTEFLDSFNPDR